MMNVSDKFKKIYMMKLIFLIFLLISQLTYASDFDSEWRAIAFKKDSKEKYEKTLYLYNKYNEDEQYVLLPYIMRLAYGFGDFEDLETYYKYSIVLSKKYSGSWNTGNVLSSAHNYMGSYLADQENYDAAVFHLNESCKIITSPKIKSFGPDMLLASKLLRHGYTNEVVKYLNDCKNIWTRDNGALDGWIASIKGGGTPHFVGSIRFKKRNIK